MQRNIYFICILSIIFLVVTYYIFYTYQTYEILPDEAKANIKSGYYDFIVDVRTKKEWDEDHLPNTISIPIGELVGELPQKITNKDAKILFICKKGIRASGVVIIAHKLGYKNVQAMIGNFKELQ